MLYYDSTVIDPRPLEDPRYWDDVEELEESTCIVADSWGIYVPQVFCQCYEKTEDVSQEDWDICLAGPEHKDYWEAWDNILSDWGFEDRRPAGCDGAESVWRIYLYQDGDLFQCARFERVED